MSFGGNINALLNNFQTRFIFLFWYLLFLHFKLQQGNYKPFSSGQGEFSLFLHTKERDKVLQECLQDATYFWMWHSGFGTVYIRQTETK